MLFCPRPYIGKTKTPASGNNMHVMMQSMNEADGHWRGDGPCLPQWPECHKYLHQSDYQEQASCIHGEKSDSHSNLYCQGLQIPPK